MGKCIREVLAGKLGVGDMEGRNWGFESVRDVLFGTCFGGTGLVDGGQRVKSPELWSFATEHVAV
jgi:hypothetical protein